MARFFVLSSHAIGVFLILTSTLWGARAQASEKVPVTATFSIVGDVVRVVGGERVQLTTLVGVNEDAHVFEPRPTDVRAILRSKLVVANGLDFEPWVGKLLQSARYQGEVAYAAQAVQAHARPKRSSTHAHSHQAKDPHAWQNPQNVVLYARSVAAALSKVDPAGAVYYQANAEAYAKELQALDAWAQEQFATLAPSKRKAITSHDAFAYLAARYGIVLLAAQGVNTQTEPSAKQIAQLIQQIQREKIRALFVENMSNPRLLAQLSKDVGVTLGARLYSDALSDPDQPGATYLQMMRYNVSQLVAAMQNN